MKFPSVIYLIAILWGIVEISFTFWNRILRVRLPREIYCDLYSWRFYLFFYISSIFLIFALISLYRLLGFKPKKNGFLSKVLSNKYINSFLIKYLYFQKEVLDRGPLKIYKIFYDRSIFLMRFTFNSFQLMYNQERFTSTSGGEPEYVILVTVPKLIVATIFFVDVVYFHYFYWFYKALYFLIIPLMVKIWLTMVTYTGETFFDHIIEDCVNYTPTETHFAFTIREGDWRLFDYRDGCYYKKRDPHTADFFMFHIKLSLAMNQFFGRMKDFHDSYKDWEDLYIGLCYGFGFFFYAISSYLF